MDRTDERTQELMYRYGKSEQGNFWVSDSIGTPHPFCITSAHINAAQDFGGMLGSPAIEALERETQRPSCGMRGCKLMFDEHEQALLISCKEDLKDASGKINEELHTYLLACKDKAEADKYAGFAFLEVK